MDYEQKYKRALERAREYLEAENFTEMADVFPELRESEDERIRKAIIKSIEEDSSVYEQEVSKEQMLAYLEKQKEQSKCPEFCSGHCVGCERNEQKEQKPAEVKDPFSNANFVRGYESGYADAKREQKPIKMEVPEGEKPVECELEDAFKNYTNTGITVSCGDFVAAPKEQKPNIEICPHSIKSKSYKEQKPTDDTAFEKWLDDWYQGSKEAGGDVVMSEAEFKNWSRGIKNMYQQQPKQEWSEDFDKEVENVHKRYPEVSFAKLTRIAYHFSKWANRHKDIEWSEEDEKTVDNAYCWLCEYAGSLMQRNYGKSSMLYGIANKLKSLRPQKLDASKLENFDPVDVLNRIKTEWPMAWEKAVGKQEWSEDEKRLINTSIAFLKYFADQGYENAVECIDWLKSLRPQPQHRDTYYDIIHDILATLKGIDFMQITPEHRVSLLNDIRVKCKNADECAKILDEPQWKPREEQMKALCSKLPVVRGGGDKVQDILETLYDDLKKLM